MNPATYHKGEKFQVSFDMEYEDETNLEIIWKLDGIKLDKVRNKNIVIDMTNKTIDIDTTDIPVGVEHIIGVVIHEIAENEYMPEEILAKFKVLEHVKEEIGLMVLNYTEFNTVKAQEEKKYKDGETITLKSENFYKIYTEGNINFEKYELKSKELPIKMSGEHRLTERFKTPNPTTSSIVALLNGKQIAKFPVEIIPFNNSENFILGVDIEIFRKAVDRS